MNFVKLNLKHFRSRSCSTIYFGSMRKCFSNNVKSSDGDNWPRRIFSGIQPTGKIHIGNYFGAIQHWTHLQNSGDDVMICIADLHSLTSPMDPIVLKSNSLEMAAYLIASGVDPERSVLFLQSSVPRHSELCWLLSCLATYARLAHLPQFKEKSAKVKEVPLGLLLYPVLQAADVLLYRATHVPVGEDQLQHLQVAAQLVRTFHHRYGGKVFPTPQPLLAEEGSMRLRSLRDPIKKMSKSDSDPKSRILLSDADDEIRMKIRKAVTDFTPRVSYDPESRPGVSNLIMIHCLADDRVPEEVVEESDDLDTGMYKRVVGDALCARLGPIRDRAIQLLARPSDLVEVLRLGGARARQRADDTYDLVTQMVGTSLLQTNLNLSRKHYGV